MKYIGLNLSRIKVLWNWTLVYWICAMLGQGVAFKKVWDT